MNIGDNPFCTVCAAAGVIVKSNARGLCHTHYKRFVRTGSVEGRKSRAREARHNGGGSKPWPDCAIMTASVTCDKCGNSTPHGQSHVPTTEHGFYCAECCPVHQHQHRHK